LSETESHNEFLELCALSTAGSLSEEEQKRLQQHLAVCASCREALRQYQAVVEEAIPALGSGEREEIDPGPGWSEQAAEQAFSRRLEMEGRRWPKRTVGVPEFPDLMPGPPPHEPSWRHLWLLYAAGILLFLSLGIYAYRVGEVPGDARAGVERRGALAGTGPL
jgi:hypothetical protein